MKLGGNILESRFARRLFSIFIISAILPVLALAALSFNRVSDQLLTQNERQQGRDTKNIGLAIYERLSLLESELQLIRSRRELDSGFFLNTLSENLQERLSGKITSLGLYDITQGYTSLLNEFDRSMALEVIGQMPVTSTEFTIVITTDSNSDKHIFMVQTFENAIHGDGVLIAELDGEYLWNPELVSDTQSLCVLDDLNNALFCSQSTSPQILDSVDSRITGVFSGNYEWQDDNNDSHLASYWRIFLRGQYDINDWTILTSIPRQVIIQPITDFQTTFILIFAVSVLLVLMLSSRQIQRVLIPLRKLTAGTQAFGESKFDSKVVIDSKDEFADLADSFNAMGSKLADQFQSLETMAEIDRLILSSLDSEDIVQTVLLRIQDIIRCDQIGMVVQDIDGEFTRMFIRMRYPDQEPKHETIESNIELSIKDKLFLEANGEGVIIELDQYAPDLLKSWTVLGTKACLVLPLFIDEILSAVVILGYKKLPDNAEQLLPETRNWAGRVAVALSNAKWQEKLYKQANYDALTGLPNRPAFRNYLKQALNRAERNKEMVGVLFIDLDRFKLVNDSMGHVIGDDYLRAISKRISECVRASDMVARLGGDEFTIVISENSQDTHIKSSISAVADKVLEVIPAPMKLEGQELTASASIGVAIYPLDADNIEDLMKNADSAMYHAKADGGGAYRFFSEELNRVITKQLKVENELRQALQNNELELYFQPQIKTDNKTFIGAESLIRWNHPGNGLTQPTEFIPIAEETKLIVDIDIWVLNAAFAQIKAWQEDGRPELCVAINLSARFFQLDHVVKRLVKLIEKHGVSMQNIELEITEGTLIEDIDKTLATLQELKALGFKLTIDDFGTGYSSLSYLKKLPIDKLKIDQSFIKNCVADPVDAALVKSIISMAHNLKMNCIAEGVETEEQYLFLKAQGCNEIQGFYFSKPLVVQDFQARYLKTSH